MPQAIKSVPTQNFLQKTLGAALLTGITASVTLNNTTGIQNLPGVFIVDRVNTSGGETPSARETVGYVALSGVTLTTLTRALAGSTDQDHAVGAIVEFAADVIWAQSIYDALSQVIAPSTGLLDTTKVVDLASAQSLSNKLITGATLSAPSINLGSGATGSLFYDMGNGKLSRVALGTSGQVLTANASLPVWATSAGGGTRTPFNTIADATTMSIDFSLGTKFRTDIATSGAHTYLATNATLGDVALLRVTFASTVSLSLNLLSGAGASISWPGGTAPTPTNTTLKTDVFGFVCNSTLPRFDGFVVGQNL